MLHTHSHMLKQHPSQVTVRFEDGAHSFPLREGATLTELAHHIGVLRTHHDGAPISIDIELKTPCPNSRAQSQPCFPITH